eukprot:CAMPEP_0196821858 /NCGR_PEP_ID=MMETSP1362-20130617/81227_1 /TAXON_ID=163516 /ORGANISM="Leptocylindrus danicus, Strain CCMP1856" /LENGTH=140 /DNA_ID=CAMNT_0042201215 /DNA_START=285 /DNA_END=707 /DNA_ORIENTATION=-
MYEAIQEEWAHAGLMFGLFGVLIVYDCLDANGVFPWSPSPLDEAQIALLQEDTTQESTMTEHLLLSEHSLQTISSCSNYSDRADDEREVTTTAGATTTEEDDDAETKVELHENIEVATVLRADVNVRGSSNHNVVDAEVV